MHLLKTEDSFMPWNGLSGEENQRVCVCIYSVCKTYLQMDILVRLRVIIPVLLLKCWGKKTTLR